MQPTKPSRPPFSSEDLALIDRFRGHPRNPIRKKRSPRSLAPLLDKLISRMTLNQGERPETAILENWAHLVGSDYAQRCTPGRLEKDGTLVVFAPNPVLRQELALRKRQILRKIHELPGCGLIKNLLLRGG
ncbi:MAG: DUF721 domain-containing protein [Verrucomicrobiota bacterium]